MAEQAKKKASPICTLEPMDLHDETEFNELLRQRIICGWENQRSDIEALRSGADAKTMNIYWISSEQAPITERYAGHIMGAIRTETSEDNLPSKQVLHIFNLFILPTHRAGGYGRAAMEQLEAWAKTEVPDLQAVTLSAIDRRYTEDDAEEWRGLYERCCASGGIYCAPKGASNEDWYARMGFVKFSTQPMYPFTIDGRDILLSAVSMRKQLG